MAIMTIPRSGHFYSMKSDNETDLEIKIGLMVDEILSEKLLMTMFDQHMVPPPHFMSLHPNHFLLFSSGVFLSWTYAFIRTP